MEVKMKRTLRLFSMAMAVVCLFAFSLFEPTYGITETVKAENRLDSSIDTLNEVWNGDEQEELGYSPLVGELTELRESDIKHFRRADGISEMVVYPYDVHFESDGRWIDIDNTLVETINEDGETVYRNAASDFVVSFASNLSSDNLVTIEYNGYTLSWGFADGDGASGQAIASVVKNEPKKDGLSDEEQDEQLVFPPEISSVISYCPSSTRTNNDQPEITYSLNGKSLSEFIKLTSAPSGNVSYSLNLNCPGLTPQCENGLIKFLDEDEEIVFIITAPFMYDAAGAECTDIEVTLTANNSGYIYSIIPNNDWLKDASRVYPVIIDPDVVLDFRGNIDNVYIRKDQPNANFTDSLYGSTDRLKLGNTSAQCMSLIKLNSLPTLNSGDVVVSARLYLTRYGTNTGDTGKEIDAYKMLAQWSEDEITWNSYQALNDGNPADTKIEAFAMSPAAGAYNIFDVTNLIKYWYRNPSKNYGIVLKASNNVNYTEYVSSRYSTSLSNHPCFNIAYINSTGIESMFSYSSQDAGRAGVGNINLFSGNLTFSHDDASIVNGVLPIGVSHVYNTNDRSTDIGYGCGWRLNYAQQITGVTLPNRQTTELYYEYIDGDGTRHYYTKKGTSNTEFVSELDRDSVLTINTSTKEITIKDKGDNKLVFACELYDHDNDSSTDKVYRGRLIRIEDANGNKTLISYASASVSILRISSISEQLAGNSSSGQSITFSYSANHLSSITSPDGLTVSYAYDSNNCLTGITTSDGNTCTYTYNNRYCMTQAKDITGYSINYTYNNASPYKVLTAQEMTGDTGGQQLTFEYKKNVTTVEDSRERKVLYQFNNYGQAVCVRDPEGRAAFAAFNTGDRNITQLAAVSKTQSSIFNLLEDHGFEQRSWTAVNASFVTTYAYTGKYSAKLSSSGGNAYVTTTASVTSGQVYTLSAYFTGGNNAKIQVLDASGTVIAESDPVQTPGTTGTDWSRGVVTFTPKTSTVTVKLLAPSGNGTIYADAVQLEAGQTPNRYNMLENSDFSDGLTHYTTNNLESDDKVITGSHSSHPEAFSAKVFRFEGNPTKVKSISQTVTVSGKKGDNYSFGGWIRTEAPAYVEGYNSNNEINLITISVEFIDSSGNTVGDASVARFDANTTDWQFACSSAVASAAYSKIRISVIFTNGRNKVYADGLQLYKETFSQAYSYDENGNLVSSVSLIGQEPKLTYDSSNNVTSSIDALDNETTYTYDGNHNLLTSTSPNGILTTNVYDANGNVTETRLGSSTTYIRSQTTYDSASALATAVTDARGNSVTYTYDSNTRQQTTITDARGNTSTYSYGNAASMLRLASLTGTGVGTVSYGYDSYGRLNSITRGSTAYNFTYDEWGRTVSTRVGDTALSTNVYDEYNRLIRVQYANGSVIYYFYDSLDRVSGIAKGDATKSWMAYGFVYDGEGNLYELRNYETDRATFFEYDHAGRCMASTEKSFTELGSSVTYGATAAAYRYKYDENNRLIQLTHTVNGTTWSTGYTYDSDGRQQQITLSNGKTIEYAYGATTGRPDYITLHLDSDYVVDWTYKSGANGSTTALISTYTNGSDARYNYNYDANGNITQIWRGSVTFANASEKYSYVYDAANQLIRENLYYGTGNSNNATITYQYDSWGNLLYKRTYAYTTGTLGTVQETVTYTYGNSSWKDQLTSYNGQSITYDASGNPTSYLGAALVWEGQRLKSYTPASTGSGRVNAYTYNYDENGIRTRKTVGNTVTDYYYNGSLLIGIVQTTTNSDGSTETSIQRFSYDTSISFAAARTGNRRKL